ncbi:hypothetical protein IMZ31_23740 (plasmid) [Pontibacillus sp. ALD_SL1]|uniref:hypothetical protein n=1 Tax=Pontibacillus sp. ALD_SL1 TaxID=2777185 RepID=UPI001A968229|nr:hypothetical protein [Pontibacillus sp. ALD_SL1]QST02465.1 hypothetical protein IMZ31_23740 [Pontibacillus sp. ALD_SL1]
MRDVTKKEMMEYRTMGREMIRRQLEKYPVESRELQEQVDRNLAKFDHHAGLMRLSLIKGDLKAHYRGLVTAVRRIRYLSENQVFLDECLAKES